jgi:peptidoglycan/LPS O-acetylase OafA/YrhL
MTIRSKDVPLEAVRGIAALITVAGHSVLAFLPQYFGIVPGLVDKRLQGSVLYLFLNGSAAVSLFFVLSGYVLTRRYCVSEDIRILVKGAIKRWPRLAGPVLVTVLVSYALFFFHLYYFEDAGRASQSFWLSQFGGAFHQEGLPDATRASIHLRDAIFQGSFLVFFRGDWLFDGTLWTMQPEIIGSFLAFGAAPILLDARKSSAFLTVGLVILACVMTFFLRSELAAFPVGVGLAVLLPRQGSLSPRIAYPALALALYLMGFTATSIGAYSVFRPLVSIGMPHTYPQIVGAAILISVIETFPAIRAPLSGRVSVFLGDLSFPIYLLHMLVICSIGSKVYLMAGAFPAIATVFVASTVASLPLIKFNDWWVARVNLLADRVLTTRRVASNRPQQGGIVPRQDDFPPEPLVP